jgi:[ribosomal protein S18]-alanine N-acetyltransferase
VIRMATPLDASHFAEIHRLCFEDPWTEESFRALLAGPPVYGYISGEKPAQSCLLVREIMGEAEVLTLATMPHARRKRLGSHLLEEAIQKAKARGVRSFFLEVAESNGPALALYAKFGFRKVGKRPNYYASKDRPAVSALILRRDLNPEPVS